MFIYYYTFCEEKINFKKKIVEKKIRDDTLCLNQEPIN